MPNCDCGEEAVKPFLVKRNNQFGIRLHLLITELRIMNKVVCIMNNLCSNKIVIRYLRINLTDLFVIRYSLIE